MEETLEQYKESIATVKELAEGDTLFFGELNADEQNMLTQYYFAFREPVGPELLDAYRHRQILGESGFEDRALRALGRLKQNAHDY